MNLLEKAMADPCGLARTLTSGNMKFVREDDKHTAAVGLTVNR